MEEPLSIQILNPSFMDSSKSATKNARRTTLSTRKRNKSTFQTNQNEDDREQDLTSSSIGVAPSAIYSPFSNKNVQNQQQPKYRRQMMVRSRMQPFEIEEPSPNVLTTVELPPANLSELRTIDANRNFEANQLAAAAAASSLSSFETPAPTSLFRKQIRKKQFRRIGFDLSTRKLKILIPSDDDKERYRRQLDDWLHTDLIEMKKQLIELNLMKHGSNARDETIRTMFMAMKQVGTIQNTNLTTQWHNYTSKNQMDDTTSSSIVNNYHAVSSSSRPRSASSSLSTLEQSNMKITVLKEV